MPRVMVVEDQEVIRSNLSQILVLSGVDVIEAEDGLIALNKLQSFKNKEAGGAPQLIISDLSMPRMDGFALLEEVRKDPVFVKTPFVLLTAHSDVDDVKRAFELGVSDYMIKPFEVEDLIAMVVRHLESNTAEPQCAQTSTMLSQDSDFFLE
jgi:CheY-like chemotaxis protein